MSREGYFFIRHRARLRSAVDTRVAGDGRRSFVKVLMRGSFEACRALETLGNASTTLRRADIWYETVFGTSMGDRSVMIENWKKRLYHTAVERA